MQRLYKSKVVGVGRACPLDVARPLDVSRKSKVRSWKQILDLNWLGVVF
jgi:hypothetical protein